MVDIVHMQNKENRLESKEHQRDRVVRLPDKNKQNGKVPLCRITVLIVPPPGSCEE